MGLTLKIITSELIIISIFFGCNKNEQTPVEPYKYQPEMPYYFNLFNNTDGFIGSDGAASIALTPQKTLWLYGDTWYGKIRNNQRKDATLSANNTIAIQDGIDPLNASLDYYFGGNNGSFFTPDNGIGILWPMHGIMIDSSLYIFFVQLMFDKTGLWGFELIESRLIKVSNPLDPPSEWQMSQFIVPHALFNGEDQTIFGAYVIQREGYLYIYGTADNSSTFDRFLVLARVKPDSITDFNAWCFYKNGIWQSDFHQASYLTSGIGFEFSVSYQPKINKYILITTELGLSNKINMQTSDSVWGTWSMPKTVYHCPDINWGKNIFCYAGKGHPEISNDNDLIITYASNSSQLSDLLNNAEIYWARFIKVEF